MNSVRGDRGGGQGRGTHVRSGSTIETPERATMARGSCVCGRYRSSWTSVRSPCFKPCLGSVWGIFKHRGAPGLLTRSLTRFSRSFCPLFLPTHVHFPTLHSPPPPPPCPLAPLATRSPGCTVECTPPLTRPSVPLMRSLVCVHSFSHLPHSPTSPPPSLASSLAPLAAPLVRSARLPRST
jgi:hypothetical protein